MDPTGSSSFMQIRSPYPIWLMFFGLIFGFESLPARAVATDDDVRVTPLVLAVKECSKSVVNLRGRKTVPTDLAEDAEGQKLKQVNGMGTGVVIDSRGYVLTNYHVVQGVKEIEVTTYDNLKTTAVLLAHDPKTDLAILKINLSKPLPKIKIGTSSDLMLAESVTAVGNAYGYEHTVTVGIISQLNRTVQVNDNQIYRNLIQTDAAINPGNSGGPLLNLNGEMIGINVAVRIGAQGIAFAIPVNDAMDVAAELMSRLVPSEVHHGLGTRTVFVENQPQLIIQSVAALSPAAKAGLVVGNRIVAVNGENVDHELDFQASLIDAHVSQSLNLTVLQGDQSVDVSLALVVRSRSNSDLAWDALGLDLIQVTEAEMSNKHRDYKLGLRVARVRPASPAAQEGIIPGDIIVAMHGYKTESIDNLAYVLQRTEVSSRESFMFYILRDKEPFWGQMRVAGLPAR